MLGTQRKSKLSASPAVFCRERAGSYPFVKRLADAKLCTRRPSAYAIEPIKAFYIFLGAAFLAALFAPIQDCDETFNYWEPSHYLSHGYGLQTWEYSPEFAIRSWCYIALHSLVGSIRRLLPRSTKVFIY